MTDYRAPLGDFRFILNDVLEVGQYAELPRFCEAPADMTDAVLTEGARFAEEVVAPLNRAGDVQGCKLADGEVRLPDGFVEAYHRFVEGGWPGLAADPAYGGQGLPSYLDIALIEMLNAANMGFYMYPGLARPAVRALAAGGSDEQKALYLPKLVSGEWAGTMNLTEPHCGTDLGLMRTKAVANADGSYAITGQKIFITSGEHPLTSNIAHLVLARIEGAPAGSAGISLFVAPKFLPDEAGAPGVRNAVQCVGLEEKMGLHASATCVMSYDGAKAWLVGEPHKGLRVMFVMMNEARLACGVQGLALAEAGYQRAADYAKTRQQGRAPGGPHDPQAGADPIIVHPDIRRMLMDQRAFIEPARALALWLAMLGDLEACAADEAARARAADYMALLTPVAKAYLTDLGFECVSNALQVHGGAGYTEDLGMSQLLRDARITLIYEGTNGVQALDLVGRKLGAKGGRAVNAFLAEIEGYALTLAAEAELAGFGEGLAWVAAKLRRATESVLAEGARDPAAPAAASSEYLRLFGLTCFAFMWARIAKAAHANLKAGAEGGDWAGKLAVGRYFLARKLPEADLHLARIEAGAAPVMALDAAQF